MSPEKISVRAARVVESAVEKMTCVFLSRLHRMAPAIFLLAGLMNFQVCANPSDGTVMQGQAEIPPTAPQMIINQTSANAFINWSTFDINAGETVTFNQPSASSVAWNYVSSSQASTISGNLNANGYVVLQNPNGISIRGSAVINTHGLVLSTASTPALDLSSGGAWEFDAPPPGATILNAGQINIAGGGSVYLIASDIENNGTISAPNGKIGLYAGEKVLVSMSPTGKGLSAEVTLPQGSVDNNGNLIANAGSIVAQAQTVNQNGVVQANSVQNDNGTIELVASEDLKLGAASKISAAGDSTKTSQGGFVVLKAGNSLSDSSGSTISVAGNAGGKDGVIEIFDPVIGSNPLQSGILGSYFAYLVNPDDMYLSSDNTDTSSSDPNFNVNDLLAYSQIDLQAKGDVYLETSWGFSTIWTLPDSALADATVSLTAGHDINLPLDDFGDIAGIQAGNNWSVNLNAGNGIYLGGNSSIRAENGNINLLAGNEVQVGWSGSASDAGLANSGAGSVTTTAGGSILVTAIAGDVNTGSSEGGFNYSDNSPYYSPNPNLGGISTGDGGSVTINAGRDVTSFPTTIPGGSVPASDPGTGAFGSNPGDVVINSGRNVYGNYVVMNGQGVINAGNDIGIAPSASDPNITERDVALSLAKGGWTLNAQNDIYLQEARNPNGVFDDLTVQKFDPATHKFVNLPTAGNHLFDYDSKASLALTAGNGVYITGYDLPRPDGVSGAVPLLLPPELTINAGSGGVNLQTPIMVDSGGQNVLWTGKQSESAITLFPSSDQKLQISTSAHGGLTSENLATLLMSDSAIIQWYPVPDGYGGPALFGPFDHSSTPDENDNPVVLDISGNMDNIILQVDKVANITVHGDMTGSSFYGVNLNSSDTTWIKVLGQIFYNTSFTSITLDQAFPDVLQFNESLPAGETFLPYGTLDTWYYILQNAVDPSLVNNQDVTGDTTKSELDGALSVDSKFKSFNLYNYVTYDSLSKKLTVTGPLSASVGSSADSIYSILESGTLWLPVYTPNGIPETYRQTITQTLPDGSTKNTTVTRFLIEPVTWLQPNSDSYQNPDLADIDNLNTWSAGKPPLAAENALIVGGMGEFDVTASSIYLGNSDGILTVGNGGAPSSPFLGDVSYSYLTSTMKNAGVSGATLKVTVTGQDPTMIINGVPTVVSSLDMPASAIASLGGGNVFVTTENGSMDLGSPDLVDFEAEIMAGSNLGLGIYSAGGGDVTVESHSSLNIDTSRIASFNGGTVTVISDTGDVNAGSGGTIAIPINFFSLATTLPTPLEYAYANGIVADTLADATVPGAATKPGDVYVMTPQGSIYADVGGILQESLSGALPIGPSVNLTAGTPYNDDWNSTQPPEYVGDIDMGNSGVIGGTVNVKATGKVTGLLISHQNANVNAQTVGNLTVLAGGTANVSGSSSGVGITIIGGQGVNANGIGSGASLLGQNVSVNGGSAQSTLGSSASSTASSQSAAQQSTQSAAQQVAVNGNGDDDEKKKKKKTEIHRTGRVTVILSAAVPK